MGSGREVRTGIDELRPAGGPAIEGGVKDDRGESRAAQSNNSIVAVSQREVIATVGSGALGAPAVHRDVEVCEGLADRDHLLNESRLENRRRCRVHGSFVAAPAAVVPAFDDNSLVTSSKRSSC